MIFHNPNFTLELPVNSKNQGSNIGFPLTPGLLGVPKSTSTDGTTNKPLPSVFGSLEKHNSSLLALPKFVYNSQILIVSGLR